ncbi:MAG: hypothetical protein HYY22_03115 [Thaumarchaeota archaeon]|nr:hypothetical protein [Nitrososphaerota archaeon]
MSEKQQRQQKQVVIDTSAFFAGTKKIRSLIENGIKLSTIDLVVFEFTKVMETEIAQARRSGKTQRLELLQALKERYPKLLRTFEIEVKSPEFSIDDVDQLYTEISKGHDSGDAMIWLKMQKAGLNTIVTDNTFDWINLGAKVINLKH